MYATVTQPSNEIYTPDDLFYTDHTVGGEVG